MGVWVAAIGAIILIGAVCALGALTVLQLTKKQGFIDASYTYEQVKMATQAVRDQAFEDEYVDVRLALQQALDEGAVALEADFRERNRYMVLIGTIRVILDEPRHRAMYSAADQRRRLTSLIDEYRKSLKRDNDLLKIHDSDLENEVTARVHHRVPPRRERHH